MALRPARAFLTVVALLLLGLALGGAVVWLRLDGPGPLARPHAVVIPKGAGGEGIARRLHDAGVIADHRLFRFAARILGRSKPLRAGEYEFPARMSAFETIRLLQSGRTVVRRLTVPEGLTVRQVMGLLLDAEGLEGPVTRLAGEGWLLPETYHYSWGDTRQGLVERMEAAMREALARAWGAPGEPPRATDNAPLSGRPAPPVLKSPEEALVLASIVEKETGVAAERSRIAAVFLNRLKTNMKLQSDPTVIYGLDRGAGNFNRALTRADLEADTPYNTYTRAGLPPRPIANPGRAAIEAVLNPVASDELYFVADGTGGHAFAKTLDEHNRNVARWRRIRDGRDGNAASPK
ncbi:MAG: endolytic transglycosylase MltG [Alphaproteobacteria bacterium]|nr:endolytic transglycosylase MltG [Alphaproteobacteria bacterium]